MFEMFEVNEEFFDLELDDDFLHDAFNITARSSTQKPPSVNPTNLLKQSNVEHTTEPKSNFRKSFETKVENEPIGPSACANDAVQRECPSVLQCENDLSKEQFGRKGLPSTETNVVNQVPSSHAHGFPLQKTLPSELESESSSNCAQLCHETVTKSGVSLGREKDPDPENGVSKDVKSATQKRLPFINYEDADWDSIFNFESVEEESFNHTQSVENSNRALKTAKVKRSASEKLAHGKRKSLIEQSSFTNVKCASTLLQNRAGSGSVSNFNTNITLQPGRSKLDSASPMVLNSPSVDVGSERLDRQIHIQKTGSPASNVAVRVKDTAFLNQVTPQNKNSVTRKRKFPGPAGILPELPPGADLSVLSEPESPIVRVSPKDAAPQDFVCSQSLSDEFEKPPWQTMLKDLACEGSMSSVTESFNISWVLQQAGLKQLPKGKVPVLCIILKNISFQGSEAKVIFADKTGEMNGMIHGKLLEEHHEKLQPGAVLVLKQVTVFSPNLRKHYLVVTPSNIISIYGILGDKTGVIDCSGSQLMAMTDKWLQEVTRISKTDPGNRQFSLNSPCSRIAVAHPTSSKVLKQEKSGPVFLSKQDRPDKSVSFVPRTATSSCASSSAGNDIVSEVPTCGVEAAVHSDIPECTERPPLTSGTAASTNSKEEEVEEDAFKDEFDEIFQSLGEW